MTLSIELDDALAAKLLHLSQLRDRPAGALLQEAVVEYLGRADARMAFLAEAESSWADFQQDGLHLTGQELQDWLSRWANGEQPALPACHN